MALRRWTMSDDERQGGATSPVGGVTRKAGRF